MNKKIGIMLMGLVLLFISACGGNEESESGEETLVVVDWGGSITEAREDSIFKPFEEEFNVKIEVESPTDYGKLKAMVEGENVTWDVVNVASYWAELAGEEGLLEKIDYNNVDKDDIVPELATDYGVGAEMYSASIAYNSDEYSEENHPENWEEFWDVDKFPGTRALYNSPIETLEAALLADGVEPENLYPLDTDRAFASLDKLKENTEVIFWDTGAEPVELLTSGSAEFSSGWSGRITAAQAEGVPVGLDYNQAIQSSESWVVPKGSKNKDLAMEFIDFATGAEVQAEFVSNMDYSPTNEQAVELLPEEVQERLGQSPELAESQIIADPEYWADNFDEVNDEFLEWMLE